MTDNDENKVRTKKEPSVKVFVAIAFLVILPAVIIGYMIDKYVQDFWTTILILTPIMGICLGVYTCFSKTRLTLIEVLVLISIAILLLSIVIPARSGGCGSSRMRCMSNLKQLYITLMLYAAEADNQWPAESSWCDSLIKEYQLSQNSVICPNDKQGPQSYAINKYIFELKPKDIPKDLVFLFESAPGSNQAGGYELLTTESHQNTGCNVVFGDGHVEFVFKNKINELKWKVE